jgi:hypothetical protein
MVEIRATCPLGIKRADGSDTEQARTQHVGICADKFRSRHRHSLDCQRRFCHRPDREFHAGADRPTEALPPEHACWVPVPKSWRELGIDADEIPSSTMASQIGQIPVHGGDFLPFLMEYRMIVEGAAEALVALVERHPQHAALLAEPARRVRKRKGPST